MGGVKWNISCHINKHIPRYVSSRGATRAICHTENLRMLQPFTGGVGWGGQVISLRQAIMYAYNNKVADLKSQSRSSVNSKLTLPDYKKSLANSL